MEYESGDLSACGICGHCDNNPFLLNLYKASLISKPLICVFYVRSIICFKNGQDFLSYLNERKMEEDKKSSDEEIHTNSYNCRCPDCLRIHGSLPLLVDVIEQNTQSQSLKTDSEPVPSTSKEVSPSRKLIKCNHCDKTFTHKGDYNKHQRRHTGEQPFRCSICDRKFAHTSNLSRHLRLHSGQKPYTCDVCNKNFSRKDKLDQHRKNKNCNRTN